MRRHAALSIGLAALAWSAAGRADTASDIASIEQGWGHAFLKRDRAFLERLVGPEFKLMSADGGEIDFTPRDRWFANIDRFVFHEFEVNTVDVIDAGDTAVATVTGRWKIGRVGMPGTRDTGFIVTDTFVKRAGTWQVIYRHSSPRSPPPQQKQAGQESGR